MRRTEARSPRPPAVAPFWPPAHDLLRAACVHAFLVALFLWPVFTGRLLSQTGALREMPPWRGAVPAVASPLPGTVSMNRMLDDQTREFLPFFLVAASSSFVYVALADLIPQLQTRLSARQTAAQISWLLAGIGLVTMVSGLAHGH